MTTKKILLYSVIYFIVVFLLILSIRSGKPSTIFYYPNHKPIESTYDLIVDLVAQKNTTGVFQTICNGLQFYGVKLGFSYKEMNFLVFVILQPAIILYFLMLTIFFYKKSKNK